MSKTQIGNLSESIMGELKKYSDAATDGVKEAVKSSAKIVKNEISANAPRRTGKYAKSWKAKTTKENAVSIVVTVHSPNKYQLAHLLEKGHAKRNGGRVQGHPHIEPAEKKGIENLEKEIEKVLKNG